MKLFLISTLIVLAATSSAFAAQELKCTVNSAFLDKEFKFSSKVESKASFVDLTIPGFINGWAMFNDIYATEPQKTPSSIVITVCKADTQCESKDILQQVLKKGLAAELKVRENLIVKCEVD